MNSISKSELRWCVRKARGAKELQARLEKLTRDRWVVYSVHSHNAFYFTIIAKRVVRIRAEK